MNLSHLGGLITSLFSELEYDEGYICDKACQTTPKVGVRSKRKYMVVFAKCESHYIDTFDTICVKVFSIDPNIDDPVQVGIFYFFYLFFIFYFIFFQNYFCINQLKLCNELDSYSHQ